MIDWLNGFYVPFQLIYDYVETDNDDDNTETCHLSQGQGFFLHLIHIEIWDASNLVALYGMQEDTAGIFLSRTRTGYAKHKNACSTPTDL